MTRQCQVTIVFTVVLRRVEAIMDATRITPTQRKIARLDERIAELKDKRAELVRQRAHEEGFRPCDDCFNGYCSMNCSTAPGYMKVSFP